MRVHRTPLWIAALTAATALPPIAIAARQAAPQPASPDLSPTATIPLDAAITTGTLPNGLRYYVRRNGRPEKRVLLQLAVVYLPFLQKAFGTVALAPGDWLACIAVASSVLWLRELSKLLPRP